MAVPDQNHLAPPGLSRSLLGRATLLSEERTYCIRTRGFSMIRVYRTTDGAEVELQRFFPEDLVGVAGHGDAALTFARERLDSELARRLDEAEAPPPSALIDSRVFPVEDGLRIERSYRGPDGTVVHLGGTLRGDPYTMARPATQLMDECAAARLSRRPEADLAPRVDEMFFDWRARMDQAVDPAVYMNVWFPQYRAVLDELLHDWPPFRLPAQPPAGAVADVANAQKRAHELLWACLTKDQRHQYTRTAGFEVIGSRGGRYRIEASRTYNVVRYPTKERFCAIPSGGHSATPLPDQLLMQKLLLETDEPGFLAIANRQGDYGVFYMPAMDRARQRDVPAAPFGVAWAALNHE